MHWYEWIMNIKLHSSSNEEIYEYYMSLVNLADEKIKEICFIAQEIQMSFVL